MRKDDLASKIKRMRQEINSLKIRQRMGNDTAISLLIGTQNDYDLYVQLTSTTPQVNKVITFSQNDTSYRFSELVPLWAETPNVEQSFSADRYSLQYAYHVVWHKRSPIQNKAVWDLAVVSNTSSYPIDVYLKIYIYSVTGGTILIS